MKHLRRLAALAALAASLTGCSTPADQPEPSGCCLYYLPCHQGQADAAELLQAMQAEGMEPEGWRFCNETAELATWSIIDGAGKLWTLTTPAGDGWAWLECSGLYPLPIADSGDVDYMALSAFEAAHQIKPETWQQVEPDSCREWTATDTAGDPWHLTITESSATMRKGE